MIILGYIGDHKKDGWRARFGWWLVRLVQSGPFKQVTHVEALLKGDNYKAVTIGSSSLRDGGVRIKDTDLTPGHWIAVDVPGWNAMDAHFWFISHAAAPYDWRGAMATILFWMRDVPYEWFCNESVGAPFIQTPDQYTPCRFMALALSMPSARIVTPELFNTEGENHAI
ncbi:MAG: hypothetical protein Q7K57_25010 [Burkholderiaceae bacterium]|nr:hypothetical protein [Burkholderiaceae bacterium]